MCARRRGRARLRRARRTRASAQYWSRFRSAWSTSPSRRAGFASRVAPRVGPLGACRRLLPCREALRVRLGGAAQAPPRTLERLHGRGRRGRGRHPLRRVRAGRRGRHAPAVRRLRRGLPPGLRGAAAGCRARRRLVLRALRAARRPRARRTVRARRRGAARARRAAQRGQARVAGRQARPSSAGGAPRRHAHLARAGGDGAAADGAAASAAAACPGQGCSACPGRRAAAYARGGPGVRRRQ